MKKYLLALGIALSSLTTVQAQEITFGVKAGPQLSGFIGSGVESESIVAAFGGVYANFKLSDNVFLQPELLYSMQGAKSSLRVGSTGLDDYGILDERINLKYLNIPIMLQYTVAQHVRLEIGPQLGILLKSELEEDFEPNQGVNSEQIELIYDLKESTKTIDFSLNIGSVYELDNNLNFTLRYSFGLTTIGDLEPGEFIKTLTSELPNSKNSVLSLGVGYTF